MAILILIIPLLVGWICGWITNYLCDVLPLTRRFTQPTCFQCQVPTGWLDHLFLHRCRQCGKHRLPRAVIVQVIMTFASILVWAFPRNLPYPLAMLLLTYLAAVAVMDLEYRVILHPVSLAGVLIGFGVGVTLLSDNSILDGILTSLLGGAAGYAIMLAFYYLGELYVRRMAKKKGLPSNEVALGFGDVNLAGVIGLILGWPAVIAGIFYAILAGGVISLFIMLTMLFARKYRAFTAIPYAPFLILAVLIIVFA